MNFEEDYDGGFDSDDFADRGSGSSLRAATRTNPRNLPCPDCKQPNRLTPRDRQLGYCCNECARKNEGGGF